MEYDLNWLDCNSFKWLDLVTPLPPFMAEIFILLFVIYSLTEPVELKSVKIRNASLRRYFFPSERKNGHFFALLFTNSRHLKKFWKVRKKKKSDLPSVKSPPKNGPETALKCAEKCQINSNLKVVKGRRGNIKRRTTKKRQRCAHLATIEASAPIGWIFFFYFYYYF